MRWLILGVLLLVTLGFFWFYRDHLPQDEGLVSLIPALKAEPGDLISATATGDLSAIKRLLAQGADPNARNRFGDTPLIWAINSARSEPTRTLLEGGADPNLTGSYGYGPLHWACRKNVGVLVQMLLEAGARPNLRDDNGESPLFHAIRANCGSCWQKLLQYQADPGLSNGRRQTPLGAAIEANIPEVIDPLIQAGANPLLPEQGSALFQALQVNRSGWFLSAVAIQHFPDLPKQLKHLMEVVVDNHSDEPQLDMKIIAGMVHRLVNQERSRRQLPALAYDEALAQIARSHSQDMSQRHFFDHINPDGDDPTRRALRMGYEVTENIGTHIKSGIGENIYQGYSHHGYEGFVDSGVKHIRYRWLDNQQLAEEAVKAWMKSPGHRANILDDSYLRQGIGVYLGNDKKIFFSQNFW